MNGFIRELKITFSNFLRNRSGAVAMIYGPMTILLMVAAGLAIDYSRSYLVKKEIGRALDAAVLAAGSLAVTDETAMQELANRYFQANLSTDTKTKYNPQLSFSITNDEVTVTSTAHVPTIIMKIVGHDYVDVDARSVAGRTLVNIEVALVLDNTGSMSGSKMTSLKSAATTLVNTLYSPEGSDEFVKFTIIPFTGAVNIGTSNNTIWWLDVDGLSAAAQEDYGSNFDYWGESQYDGMTAFEAMAEFEVDWQGCVRARVGTAVNENGDTVDLDLWDIPPNNSNIDTKWAPYLKRLQGYYVSSWWSGPQKPSNSQIKSRLNYSGTCPQIPILPLTNDKTVILDTIDDMVASGNTSVPIGLIWGWRALSSSEPFTEGADYDEPNTRKVVVVLTDGQNHHGYYTSDIASGIYSAYGMPAYDHLGTGWLGDELDNKLATICTNVKSKGILVYSITFQLNDTATQNLMRNCATQDDMYFNSPNGSSLQDAFDQIATGLQKLQLKQ